VVGAARLLMRWRIGQVAHVEHARDHRPIAQRVLQRRQRRRIIGGAGIGVGIIQRLQEVLAGPVVFVAVDSKKRLPIAYIHKAERLAAHAFQPGQRVIVALIC
jgi:hypothetical protein